MFVKIARNIYLGLGSIMSHRTRSALTVLGIIFGVASVICMLSIGEGLSFEAREQIRRLGSDNVIIESVQPSNEFTDSASAGAGGRSVLRYGLTHVDATRIRIALPDARVVVPTRQIRKDVWLVNRHVDAQILGTVPWFPEIRRREMIAGRFFTDLDMEMTQNVCIISRSLFERFSGMYPVLGNTLRVGPDFFTVIGVIEDAAINPGEEQQTASRFQMIMPLTTVDNFFGQTIWDTRSGGMSAERVEISNLTVTLPDSDDVINAAETIATILQTGRERQDYEIKVPLQLLEEKERTKRIYNMVLGLMAAISLLVGGIGIMNIMLASVSERTQEIGIRRAIGARKVDIMLQFLIETILLSGLGGIIGVIIGISLPYAITASTGLHTITTTWSVLLAFGISAIIGLIFGFYPAYRAAGLNPITALRHE